MASGKNGSGGGSNDFVDNVLNGVASMYDVGRNVSGLLDQIKVWCGEAGLELPDKGAVGKKIQDSLAARDIHLLKRESDNFSALEGLFFILALGFLDGSALKSQVETLETKEPRASDLIASDPEVASFISTIRSFFEHAYIENHNENVPAAVIDRLTDQLSAFAKPLLGALYKIAPLSYNPFANLLGIGTSQL